MCLQQTLDHAVKRVVLANSGDPLSADWTPGNSVTGPLQPATQAGAAEAVHAWLYTGGTVHHLLADCTHRAVKDGVTTRAAG
mmetsp:Transcript_68025/g.94568  ORF Transcript_68025/g.94568 Transcript_68025/m.94568 type:complete len:82 (-) Transcript_68025:74-319(-)